MPGISRDQLKEALGLMHEARKILFHRLHARQEASRDLADGIEKLSLAFEFAENPEKQVCLCPACECLFYLQVDGKYQCLSCDQEWPMDASGADEYEASRH